MFAWIIPDEACSRELLYRQTVSVSMSVREICTFLDSRVKHGTRMCSGATNLTNKYEYIIREDSCYSWQTTDVLLGSKSAAEISEPSVRARRSD